VITYFTWTILRFELQRFVPAVLAVAFSAVLIAMQAGLLLGMFKFASLPVDRAPSSAQIWVGGPNIVSVDMGRPIPVEYLNHLATQPNVDRCEIFNQAFAQWLRPNGGLELCMVLGSELNGDPLGAMIDLTPEMRSALGEVGTVVVDESDLDRLGVSKVGDVAEVGGHRVRVVGIVSGYNALAGAYVFCSLDTSRSILQMDSADTVYLLGQCKNPADAAGVVEDLRRRFPNLSSFTREELSLRSRVHWLTKTKAGLALGYAAALGLLIGAVVTSQTLYSATAASLREYAVLWSLGIPVQRMLALVLAQSFWVGVVGVLVAVPFIYALAYLAERLGLTVSLPFWIMAGTIAITMLMAMLSGLLAIRLLWRIEPATLLH
jgi:putative ABC transport system permease protein